MKIMIASLILDAAAIALSIYSGIMSHRSNRDIHRAIKDLHESHDELHEVIKRIG